MKRLILASAILFAGLQAITFNVQAEVVGGVVVGVTVEEAIALANGWSAKNSILGKPVFNENGDKIGIVDDLIIAPNKSLSYAIIGAGGFLGIGKYDVAIPVTKINEVNGKMEIKGATKASIKQMPEFVYATNTANREAFIANAEQDIQKGKEKLAELNKKASSEKSDLKIKVNAEIVELKQQIKNAETKMVFFMVISFINYLKTLLCY